MDHQKAQTSYHYHTDPVDQLGGPEVSARYIYPLTNHRIENELQRAFQLL